MYLAGRGVMWDESVAGEKALGVGIGFYPFSNGNAPEGFV